MRCSVNTHHDDEINGCTCNDLNPEWSSCCHRKSRPEGLRRTLVLEGVEPATPVRRREKRRVKE